jgi:multidrug efflux pump subunit AcrA (membrane-fusion protein)
MRKLLITIILLVTFPALVHAGLFGDSVDLADLAQLSQKGLEDLKDSEFEVFLAQVRLAGAKDDLKKANGELKAVKKNLSSRKPDLKATEAEVKAAKEIQDKERFTRAESALQKSQENYTTAELNVAWKAQEVKARKALVEKAELELDIAEIQRDLARVAQLVSEKVPAAQKHSAENLEKSLKKKQKDLTKAKRDEEREMWEAKKSKEDYERKIKE